MMQRLLLSALLGLVATALFPIQEAAAQWNNAPYQPAFRGAAGGVGMSPGYRQVMILDRLGSVSRNNLYRLPGGTLVDVARQDGQAFVVSPEGFPLARERSVARPGGFGFGLQPSSYRGRAGATPGHISASASVAFGGWWPMVAGGAVAEGSYRTASTAIDGWIAQLDSF